MIKLKELIALPKLRSPIVLIGMPGIALVGKIAALSVINSLNSTPYGEIYYHDLPPHVIINDAQINMPKIVIYINQSPKSQEHDLIIMTGDYQPTTSLGIYTLSDYICQLCKNLDTYLIISMGAFVPESMGDKRKVYVSSTDKEWIDFFLGSSTQTTVILKGGYISGANGIIPAWSAIHYDIPGVSLLADTPPSFQLQIDPAASKELIRVLNALFQINVDETLLDQKIDRLDQRFSEMMQKELSDIMPKKPDEQEKPQPYIG